MNRCTHVYVYTNMHHTYLLLLLLLTFTFTVYLGAWCTCMWDVYSKNVELAIQEYKCVIYPCYCYCYLHK